MLAFFQTETGILLSYNVLEGNAEECKYTLLEDWMYYDSYLARDSGLPQSYRAVVKLLFLFPDILDFLPAAVNGVVEQCECWLETGGAYPKYLEMQTMGNNVSLKA